MCAVMAEDAVLRELEQIRGELGRLSILTGDIGTSCAVLVSRSDRNERDLRDLRKDMEDSVGAVKTEVDALKERRWPMATIAVLASVAAAVIAGVALFVK